MLAALIGTGAGFIAYLLYNLITFFTNLFFYQRVSLESISPDQNQLGLLVIVIPALGGLIVGLIVVNVMQPGGGMNVDVKSIDTRAFLEGPPYTWSQIALAQLERHPTWPPTP